MAINSSHGPVRDRNNTDITSWGEANFDIHTFAVLSAVNISQGIALISWFH